MSTDYQLRREWIARCLLDGVPASPEAPWKAPSPDPIEPALITGSRLVNHFTLGADPEFMFTSVENGEIIAAESLGLHVGQAFGCDLNGTLVELRPHHGNSALDVVSSLWITMKWLMDTMPSLARVKWLSDPLVGRNGRGGHIHFGRRRPLREREVQALDKLYELLIILRVFDAKLVQARRENTHYGLYGDFRSQRHGYEYRAMPTWLASPLQAMSVITLSKLVVMVPSAFLESAGRVNTNSAVAVRDFLLRFLCLFKALDDDAAIVHRTWVAHTTPKALIPTRCLANTNRTFNCNWGIFAPATQVKVNVFPNTIEAPREVRDLVLAFLLSGDSASLTKYVPTPTWNPSVRPKEYKPVCTHTAHIYGLGELCWDLVYSTKLAPVSVLSSNTPNMLVNVSGHWSAYRSEVEAFFKAQGLSVQVGTRGDSHGVSFSTPLRRNHLPVLRELLTTVFPVWSIFSDPPDFRRWETAPKVIPALSAIVPVENQIP